MGIPSVALPLEPRVAAAVNVVPESVSLQISLPIEVCVPPLIIATQVGEAGILTALAEASEAYRRSIRA